MAGEFPFMKVAKPLFCGLSTASTATVQSNV